MGNALTKEYLDEALGKVAKKEDLQSLATKGDLDQLTAQIQASFSDLQSSVDRYLKRTETWHDELRVLQARHDRLVHLLDQKGIVQEEETHIAY